MAKLPKEPDYSLAAEPEGAKKRKPCVYLRIPFDEAEGVDVDDIVSVTFRGKVKGIDKSKRSDGEERAEIDVEDPQIRVKVNSSQMADMDEDMDVG